MRIMECVGPERKCAACGHLFEDTEDEVYEVLGGSDVFCCTGDTEEDRKICVNGWKKVHPNSLARFVPKRLSDVHSYWVWPGLSVIMEGVKR